MWYIRCKFPILFPIRRIIIPSIQCIVSRHLRYRIQRIGELLRQRSNCVFRLQCIASLLGCQQCNFRRRKLLFAGIM
ncbi:hypothetical protein A2881_02955 [Candidatus Peribacteria bacterium RIFCSPHIGHO2_01_FULL_55_13]|nr:MAG: hypothetical protein A2881_02955 [Candidatus Peribacteria bacterium RIFCSPHIGHO2_01_FULL_55_13]OGJ64558.1 MAG: hypothetical protein A3F36_02325 [Candidatus Peribacteria bacterium RIFCSPHIGHO2_12_FULL_55_11]